MSIFDEAKRTDLLTTVQNMTGQKGKASGGTVAFFCPKHTERTPSLMVDAKNSTWHAFCRCSVGGDVVDFTEWMLFGTVSKGKMLRMPNNSLDKEGNRYKALEHLVSGIETQFKAPVERVAPKRDFSDRKIIDSEVVTKMHNNRDVAINYFVGKRCLTERTVDERLLGASLAHSYYYKWNDAAIPDTRFECIRYSIPWMFKGRPYMVNYRRDDADCLRRIYEFDPEYTWKIRKDIASRTDMKAEDITDETLSRYIFGDKYMRNKGSVGFTIFNVDRLKAETWLPYLTINEAEISAISCEQNGLYSIAASYKWGIDYKSIFQRVHQPIIFADNDGGTGLEKAYKLADAIGNPRTLIQLVPAPFKDLNELTVYDAQNGTRNLYNLKREIGIS